MKKKSNISSNDLKYWNEYVKNPNDIFDKEHGDQNINLKKRFKFDLHGFSLSQANKKVKEIIINSANKGIKEILLVTGKGIHSKIETNSYVSDKFSKLRYSVPDFVHQDKEIKDLIISVKPADKKSGGEGAIIIKLKSIK